MKKHRKLLSVLMIILLLIPNFNVPLISAEEETSEDTFEGMTDIADDSEWQGNVIGDVEEQVELGDWEFNVFGSNTGDDANPDPTIESI